jgi:hypothetical protein
MNNFIASSAGRIAARIQSIGGSFDPEVLSLPGGSIIAVCLWLYSSTVVSAKRGAARALPVVVKAAAPPASAGCTGHH